MNMIVHVIVQQQKLIKDSLCFHWCPGFLYNDIQIYSKIGSIKQEKKYVLTLSFYTYTKYIYVF